MGKVDQRIILAISALFICNLAWSQFQLGFVESQSFPMEYDGSLRLSTVGGFTNPQFSEIDLNQDGVQDLFVFDRASDTWKTFLFNTATDEYDYAPAYQTQFPDDLSEVVLIRDYNCDGNPDIFDFFSSGFRVHKSIEQNPWMFELVTESIQSNYGSVTTGAFLLPGDIPAIIDIDGDEDLDLLTFGNGDSENTIVWHENQSMDQYGNCDSLEFVVNTDCWGGFQEPPNGSVIEAISCRPEASPPVDPLHQATRFHPGSTIFFTDVDDDGDYDLALGDIQTTQFVYAPNIGTPNSPEIDVSQQTTDFPNATDPTVMQYMTAGYSVDFTHDGKLDLLTTTNNSIDSSCNAGHVWSYRNTATSGASYVLHSKSFLLDEMIDLGTGTVPLYIDVDNDGLQDLLVASDFFRSPNSFKRSRIHFFKNTGTASSPNFTHQDYDFAGLSTYNFQAAFPCLGDLDSDGDLDMLIGDADGLLHYFRNDPSNGVANFSLVSPNYMGINTIGQHAAPTLFDMNGDGLLDLIVGERIGTLSYFENTGTAQVAQFTSSPTVETLGEIDVSFFCCDGFAAPSVVDNPGLGTEPFLFVGSSEKKVFIYSIPEALTDPFVKVDSINVLADRLTPIYEDFDDDGIIEMLTGVGEGGLKYFDRDDNYFVGYKLASHKVNVQSTLYPNPTRESLTVNMKMDGFYEIEIFSLDGRMHRSIAGSGSLTTIDVSELQGGYYIMQIHRRGSNEHLKFQITP
ncbi:MAG: hypothetical protein Salg2KO_17300 [Salibacteraceae bacterium]